MTFCIRIHSAGANRHICTGGPCCKGDCQPKFVLVWTDSAGTQKAKMFATRKQAESSLLLNRPILLNIFTRKQFEAITTAAERQTLLVN